MGCGVGAYRGPMTGAGHDHRRGAIPFWAHQLVELLLALVLLVEGARSGAGVEVLGAAVVLLLFALATDGPLGAWRALSRRAHRVGDFVLAALLAVAPLALGVTDAFTVALLLLAAVCLVWLGLRGDFSTRERGSRWRRAATGATPTPSPTPATAPTTAAPASAPARTADRPPATATARPTRGDLGRALGRLRVAGPRVAGRTVGRAIAKSSSPEATTASPPDPPASRPDEPQD